MGTVFLSLVLGNCFLKFIDHLIQIKTYDFQAVTDKWSCCSNADFLSYYEDYTSSTFCLPPNGDPIEPTTTTIPICTDKKKTRRCKKRKKQGKCNKKRIWKNCKKTCDKC